MIRMWSVFAVGAAILAGVDPSAAKQNSCDGPIVLGTTISVTGINSSLAGRWDKMTDSIRKRIQQERRRVSQLLQQEAADQVCLL